MSLLEESSCQNHNAWAASVLGSLGTVLICWKNVWPLADKETCSAEYIPPTKGHTLHHITLSVLVLDTQSFSFLE